MLPPLGDFHAENILTDDPNGVIVSLLHRSWNHCVREAAPRCFQRYLLIDTLETEDNELNLVHCFPETFPFHFEN